MRKRFPILGLTIFLAAAAFCPGALAAPGAFDATFREANADYDAGDYAGAINKYEQLVEGRIVNVSVFYNLGNAYWRAGYVGPAIANYERALQLDPGFENARENLTMAVQSTERRLARPLPSDLEQSLLFWHYNLTQRTTHIVAIVLWWLFWALLALHLVRPHRNLLRTAFLVALIAVAFGLSAWVKAHGELYAVANPERQPVYFGTNEAETVHFELYAGDRVIVDQRRHGWARVTTVDGKRGWTKEDGLTLVGPPYNRPELSPAEPTESSTP